MTKTHVTIILTAVSKMHVFDLLDKKELILSTDKGATLELPKTDEKLILDHVIMEFFNEDPSELGCSVIFVEDVMSSLSDNIKTVIDIRDRNTGVLLLEEGKLMNKSFQLDHFPAEFNKEQLPR